MKQKDNKTNLNLRNRRKKVVQSSKYKFLKNERQRILIILVILTSVVDQRKQKKQNIKSNYINFILLTTINFCQVTYQIQIDQDYILVHSLLKIFAYKFCSFNYFFFKIFSTILLLFRQYLILMDFVSKIIQNTNKPKLMAFTCFASLVAPYLISGAKNIIMQSFNKQKQKKALHVGIQLGGTNYNVAIGKPLTNSKGELMDFQIIMTKDGKTYQNPQEVLDQIVAFLKANQPQENSFTFIGIASFGPLCLDKTSPRYGSITTTPKKLWQNMNLLNFFQQKMNNKNVKIDTDVNSCAFAQFKLGNHKVKDSLVYITVGTGVGVGVVVHGKTVHGLTHPQGGHIIVDRHNDQYQNFGGVCPFHSSCLEGMVCNRSIADRLNVSFTQLHEISDQQKIWRILGNYLAQLCLNITLTISPQVIVIGGGIMNRKILYKYIHQQFIKLLAKYVDHPLYTEGKIQNYIKSPTLGSLVGVKGAMILKYQQKN